MNKKILVIGVVLLIIGGALAAVGYTGMMNKSAEAMEDDYNEEEMGYDSYDEGDTVTITGEITNKTEVSQLDAHGYEIDDTDWGFLSSEDVGDEGDRVTVTIELQEGGYWEAQSYSNAMTSPMTLLGLVLLIVGVIVAIVGAMKGGGEEEFEEEPYQEEQYQEPAPEQPTQEPPQQQEDTWDEEEF